MAMNEEIVEAEGHLIDSQLLNVMFDTVVRHDAAFEVLEFRIGRTNEEPSFVSMRVTARTDGELNDVLEELVVHAGEAGAEQLPAVREVHVHGGAGHAGFGGDLVHRDVDRAPLAEQPAGDGDDLIPPEVADDLLDAVGCLA